MRALTIVRTALALAVLSVLPAESWAQHGGGFGGAGFGGHGAVGTVGGQFGGAIAPNGYGGVNMPASGVVGTGVGAPGWYGGYGYPYGANSFGGMGMSPMDQEMAKQSQFMNMQAQTNLAMTLAEESRVRMMIAEQKASRSMREDRDTRKPTRSSSARTAARGKMARETDPDEPGRPSLESFVGMNTVRWPVHGFAKPTLAIRAQADQAVLAVRTEVAAQGVARPETVARARSKLAQFRSSARRQLPVKSRTLVELEVFLRGLDQALGASTG